MRTNLEHHYFRHFPLRSACRYSEADRSIPMRRVGSLTVSVALCASLFAPSSRAQKQGQPERKVVSKVAPVYSELAKRMHLSGMVKMEVVVRANGSVKAAKPMGGNPVLVESATDAVRKWKFAAAPEETTEVVQLTFELQ